MKTILLVTTLLAASNSLAAEPKIWGNQIDCNVQVKTLSPSLKGTKDMIRNEEKQVLLQMDPNARGATSARATLIFPQSKAKANIKVLFSNYESQKVGADEKSLTVKATMIVEGVAQGTASASAFAPATERLIMNRITLSSLGYQQMEDYVVENKDKSLSLLDAAKILFPNQASLVTDMSVYCNAVDYERAEVSPKF